MGEKDAGKMALLAKILESKEVLFGKFSEKLTNKDKELKWSEIRQNMVAEGFTKYEDKNWKQLRDVDWATTKKRSIEKRDKRKKTGEGSVQMTQV
jgi:hypothetical protein